MIFEIEGTDNSGKTTVCKKIGTAFKLESNPLSMFQEDFSNVALGMCFAVGELATKLQLNILCDRLILSNYVYENVLPEKRKKATSDEILFDFYSKFQTKTLVLMPDDSIIQERFEARGDPLVKVEIALKANAEYRRIYEILNEKFPGRFLTDIELFSQTYFHCKTLEFNSFKRGLAH